MNFISNQCPVCDSVDTTSEITTVRGDDFSFPGITFENTSVISCRVCGEVTIGLPEHDLLLRSIARETAQSAKDANSATLSILRSYIGLTGISYAKALGVSNVSVSRWETGQVPVPKYVSLISKLLVLMPRKLRELAMRNALDSSDEPLTIDIARLREKSDTWQTYRLQWNRDEQVITNTETFKSPSSVHFQQGRQVLLKQVASANDEEFHWPDTVVAK